MIFDGIQMGTYLMNSITDESPLTIPMVYFALKNNNLCPRNLQVVKLLRLISFEISMWKAKLWWHVSICQDSDSTANYWIFNFLKTCPGFNHSKSSIENVEIRPIQVQVEKQRWPIDLKFGRNLHKHGSPLQVAIWLVVYSSPKFDWCDITCISHFTHSLTLIHWPTQNHTHWLRGIFFSKK